MREWWFRPIVAAVSVLALAFGAAAQPLAPPVPTPGVENRLTLSDAIAEARARNADLAALVARAEAAAARAAIEGALMPPMVEGQIWQWPVTTISPANVDMYMFMLEQALPGRGKRDLRSAVAVREAAVIRAEADVEAVRIAADVRRAFTELLRVRLERATASRARDQFDVLVGLAEAAYAEGRGSQADVVRAALARARALEPFPALDADERAATARLVGLMGRPAGSPVEEIDEPTLLPEPAIERLEAALEGHPEIAASAAVMAAAEASGSVASAERKPDWVIQGGYMLMPGEAGAWTARVGLTWPTAPWARTRLTALSAEAAARVRAARAEQDVRRVRIQTALREAHARLAGARQRLALVESDVRPRAAHLVEATRLSVGAGQAPVAALLEAQQLELDADTARNRALVDAHLAWADLEAAAGRSVTPAALPNSQSPLPNP